MKIGIDGSCLANRRGFGRFTRLLLNALARCASDHDFHVFIDRPSADQVEIPGRVNPIVVDVAEAPARAASAGGRRNWRDLLAMSRAVARSGIDLIYFPATYSFFPVWNVKRIVVTMHDTLPLTHPDLVFPTRAGRIAWRLKEGLAARCSDRIVTVSEASRQAILAWSGWPDQKIRVITEGPGPAFFPRGHEPVAVQVLARHGISAGQRFLLYVGGLSPHKNLPRMIEAFAAGATPDVGLVLVGDLGDVFHTHVPEIRQAIERHGLGNRVILTGFVPDDDLVFLYSRATALVQPSLLEGFGLPAVEAMACGTPVIASRAGSLPEVVGDAGLFFDPTNVSAMAAALRAFLGNPELARRLAGRTATQAAKFAWDRSARALLECFDELDVSPRESVVSVRSAA
jgi:glycosyltransferase involved in cell wall biosynthesis